MPQAQFIDFNHISIKIIITYLTKKYNIFFDFKHIGNVENQDWFYTDYKKYRIDKFFA